MDTALPAASDRSRSFAGVAILLLVGLLIAAALLAYAGSRQHRVPPAFGPAGNGSMYFVTANGDISAADPATGTTRSILAGTRAQVVLPSKDGQRIAILSKVIGGDQLSVANQDGSDLHVLQGTWTGFSELDWSPAGDQVAIVSEVAGAPSLSVLQADGSAATTLPLGLEVHNFWYLPDGRFLFKGTTTDAGRKTYGIYTANGDGTGRQAIEPPTSSDGDWQSVSPSPDGRSVVYHRWRDPGELGRLHVVDLASGADRPVAVAGTVAGENHEEAQFSPDGGSILFDRFGHDGDQNVRLAVVPATGGEAIPIGPAVRYDVSPVAGYSPDGKSIMAYYPSLKELWLLDPTGGRAGGDRKLSLTVTADTPTWQRVAP